MSPLFSSSDSDHFHVDGRVSLFIFALLGFEPSLNGFARIGQRLIRGRSLRPTASQRRNLCDKTLSWISDSHPAHEHGQQSLLEMQAILGLGEDQRLRAFHDFGADFQASVGGQAVHDDGVFGG